MVYRTLLSLLVLASLVCGCTTSPSPTPTMTAPTIQGQAFTVVLDIYSGFPNPTWMLSSAEAVKLTTILSKLEPTQPSRSRPEHLGYRGFVVQPGDTTLDTTQCIRAYYGLVEIETPAGIVYYDDPQRQIEQWLLVTAKPRIPADVVQYVAEELTKDKPPDCPHIPLGGFYDVWRNEQVWPRLGCAVEAAIPINGTEAYLCCNVHSLWVQEESLFVVLEGHGSCWAFVADGSGLPAEAVFVTPTWPATSGPPSPTPVPTPTPLTATPTPSPSPPPPTVTPSPLPTVILMTRSSWPLSEPCFRASGRHGWLANLPPWAEKCHGLSASNETLFSGAMEQFEGGWLLWNGNVCFALFADGTWTMF
jgi:hypothetical protein